MKVAAPATRIPGTSACTPMLRRSAHWVQTVTRPPAPMSPSRGERMIRAGDHRVVGVETSRGRIEACQHPRRKPEMIIPDGERLIGWIVIQVVCRAKFAQGMGSVRSGSRPTAEGQFFA